MSEPLLQVDGVFKWFESDGGNEKDNFIGGRLEVAANGTAFLSLIGMLEGAVARNRPLARRTAEDFDGKWIVGVLKDSRIVFLGRLYDGPASWGVRISHETYRAQDCLVFSRVDEEIPDFDAIKEMRIDIEQLGDWLGRPAISVEVSRGSPVVRGRRPRKRVLKLPDGKANVVTTLLQQAPGTGYRSATLEQMTTLELVPKKPMRLEAARDALSHWEDIVLLIGDASVTLPWPVLRFSASSCTYYFARANRQVDTVDRMKAWTGWVHMVEKFPDFASNLQTQRDILGPGLYLYLGLRRAQDLYLENRFSTAIFGLESLHRRVGPYADKGKLEAKVARILKVHEDGKDKTWLEGRLRHAAEPTLEERLFLTLDELKLGLEETALRTFCKECADLRNQVAHLGGQRDGGYDDFAERMRKHDFVIRPLYHAVLLRRLGVAGDVWWRYFHDSPSAFQLRKRFKEVGLVLTRNEPGVVAAPEKKAKFEPSAKNSEKVDRSAERPDV